MWIRMIYERGSMAVQTPLWFSEPKPHQRKFYKMLQRRQTCSENRQAADELRLEIRQVIREAETEKQADRLRKIAEIIDEILGG